MTALEFVNALVWPGHFGDLLACTAIQIPPQDGTDGVDGIAERFDVSGWRGKPWILVTVRLLKPGEMPVDHVLIAPEGAAPSDIADDVHAAAMRVIGRTLHKSATVFTARGPREVWDCSKLTGEPIADRTGAVFVADRS